MLIRFQDPSLLSSTHPEFIQQRALHLLQVGQIKPPLVVLQMLLRKDKFKSVEGKQQLVTLRFL